MRYIFGDSYGDLGNRELATDAAGDQRYFNSLAAQRAADAAAAQQAQFGADYQLKLADLGQRRADTEVQRRFQLAQFLNSQNQFAQTLGLNKAHLGLEQAKFDYSKTQLTPAEIMEKERIEAGRAKELNNLQMTQNVADTLNQLDAVNARKANIPSPEAYAQAKSAQPLWRMLLGILPGVSGRGTMAADALTPQFSGDVPPDVDPYQLPFAKRTELANTALVNEQAPLLKSVDDFRKAGLLEYVRKDPRTGKWVSTYQPRFSFGPRSGTTNPAVFGTPGTVGRPILRFNPATGTFGPATPLAPSPQSDLSE